MTCGQWQAEYHDAALHGGGQHGNGTVVLPERVRPNGCPIPSLPG